MGGTVRAMWVVVRQFASDVVVVWPMEAWLGAHQRHHGGAP